MTKYWCWSLDWGLLNAGQFEFASFEMGKKGNTKDELETLKKKKKQERARQNNKQPSGNKRPPNVRTEAAIRDPELLR